MSLHDALITVGIPAITVLLMVIVGLELTVADFRRIARYPKAVIAGTAAQVLVLPVLALLFIVLMQPPPYIAAGLIVLAACPGGALSNFYTCLADADAALSVTLTAVSTLISLVTLPLIVTLGFALFLNQGAAVAIPLPTMMRQLLLVLVVPVVAGMLIRHHRSDLVLRHGTALRVASMSALALLVGLILHDQADLMMAAAAQVAVNAVLLACLTLMAGYAVSRLLRLSGRECFALTIEFAVRNMAVAILIGVTLLGRPDFVAFGVMFFLVELPIILLAVAGFRFTRRKRGNKAVEDSCPP